MHLPFMQNLFFNCFVIIITSFFAWKFLRSQNLISFYVTRVFRTKIFHKFHIVTSFNEPYFFVEPVNQLLRPTCFCEKQTYYISFGLPDLLIFRFVMNLPLNVLNRIVHFIELAGKYFQIFSMK